MKRIAAHCLALLLTSAGLARCNKEETHGFVATLGNDTTSVERVTRTGNHIVGDAVERSPTVVRRHWEMTLAADGKVRSWQLDSHYPNGAPGETDMHHELQFDAGKLHIIRRAGRDTSDTTVRNPYPATVPWNAYLYSTYEVLFDVARSLPDTVHIGQYFFEGWDEGHVGFATVRRLDGGRFGIRSTGLSGEGEAQVDEQGRMLYYSGEGTTYKQEVTRVADVGDVDALTARFAADEKTRGVPNSLSVRDTARGIIGAARFAIDYSRPLARGRTLLGRLIPYDRVWRTGANAATQMSISAPIKLGALQLDSGTYTLWTLPTANNVKLIVNRQTGQWGTQYDKRHDIARIPMKSTSVSTPVEQFTIRLEPGSNGSGALIMEWGTFRWSVPVH